MTEDKKMEMMEEGLRGSRERNARTLSAARIAHRALAEVGACPAHESMGTELDGVRNEIVTLLNRVDAMRAGQPVELLSLDAVERRHAEAVLEGRTLQEAANILGVNLSTLYRKRVKWGHFVSAPIAMLLLALLPGCAPYRDSPPAPRVLTSTQAEYMKAAPIEIRASMEDCLADWSENTGKHNFTWSFCQASAERLRSRSNCPSKASGGDGPSVGEIATGTAIGYGAAKMLLGK